MFKMSNFCAAKKFDRLTAPYPLSVILAYLFKSKNYHVCVSPINNFWITKTLYGVMPSRNVSKIIPVTDIKITTKKTFEMDIWLTPFIIGFGKFAPWYILKGCNFFSFLIVNKNNNMADMQSIDLLFGTMLITD